LGSHFQPRCLICRMGGRFSGSVSRAALQPRISCSVPLPAREGCGVYDRTKILDEGMQASLDGLPIESCPYLAGSSERGIWLEGWNCAAEDVTLSYATVDPCSSYAA
jgi:ribosome modulation factor